MDITEDRLFAGKYRIRGELGRGGMGVVFRAEDVTLGRPVALKFLPPGLPASRGTAEHFVREARVAAGLDNPHICTIYEAGEEDGRQYIAMALIEGPTLRERIARGRLPVEEALTIAHQIADGLAAAHARRIVHRDIKPGNVMLAGGRQAKITDFGLARVEGSGLTTLTAGIVGTAAYMAPEQIQGHATDARADIWSLGCVMYEMLTGQAPFRRDTLEACLYAVVHDTPRPIAEWRGDVPERLVLIVGRCLEKDLARRYGNAQALLADLDSLAAAPGGHADGATRKAPSVAVLPFVDMSSDQSQAYFGEGIAEELIHALAPVHGLRVVARTSAFALAGKDLDVREIGRMLNVDAVLEGSVRQAGSRLRITAQLVNVENGFHLWSDRFDREAGDIFAIQDELSLAIVEHLKVTLQVGEKAALQKRSTANPEAYALYLKGLYFLARPRPDSVETALRFYREALALDPGFAKAWTGIGYAHAMRGNLNFAPPNEAWPQVKAALAEALALDGQLTEAHALAATLSFSYDWDWAAAGVNFQRVLAFNPGYAFTHGEYAWYLLNRRRFPEALREIRLALSLDPLSPLFYSWSVGLHAAAGECDAAIADFERSREIDPTFGLSYFHAGVAYWRQGELDRAVATFEEVRRLGTHPGWADSMFVVINVQRGELEEARRGVRAMIEQKEHGNVASVSLGCALAAIGDVDGAIGWLERGVEARESLVPFLHIYVEMFAPALVRHPRFRELLARLSLAEVA